MKVEVRSKEIIRPSSPTPESLKNYKLSLLDQLAINFKTPYVVFYDSANSGAYHSIDGLKKSLSKTLSLMYPLTGRVQEDKLTIECNDQGVEFIVADVAEPLLCVLDNPEIMERVKPLIPDIAAYEPNPVGKALLGIQVNRFSCGGMAIGLFFSHVIIDGIIVATFLKTWAAINRGCAVNGSGFVSDLPSAIFPPLTDTSGIERLARKGVEAAMEAREKYTIRRFVIPANAVAKLREELTFKDNNILGSLQRPSRTVALAAFVWDAVMNGVKKVNAAHALSCMVNLRGRMDPPLPPLCIGNMVHGITVQLEAKNGETENITSVNLARKIRGSLRRVNDGVARKLYGERGFFRAVLAGGGGDEMVKKDVYTLYISSLCGLPFCEADFGWGSPRSVMNVPKNSTVLFFDAVNGGVEMWMGLPNEVMHALMQNHHFLGYVQGFPKSNL